MTSEVSIVDFLELPNDFLIELKGYMQMVNNVSVRSQIEDLIVGLKPSSLKDNDAESIRRICLKSILNYIGLSTVSIKSNEYSKRFCYYAFRVYREGRYREISQFNKSVLNRVNVFDDCIIECLFEFVKSDYFDESVLASVTNSLNIDRFINMIFEFGEMFPKRSRKELIRCILRCRRPLSRTGKELDDLVSLAEKLMCHGINYVDLSKIFGKHNDTYSIVDLGLYLYKLDRLQYEYGIDRKSFKRILRIRELNDIIYILSLGICVDIDKYMANPSIYIEYAIWSSQGFPMKYYVESGYVKLNQLRILRKILQLDLDPLDFNFNPSMSAKEMIVIFESWQTYCGFIVSQSASPISGMGNRVTYNKSSSV